MPTYLGTSLSTTLGPTGGLLATVEGMQQEVLLLLLLNLLLP